MPIFLQQTIGAHGDLAAVTTVTTVTTVTETTMRSADR